MTDTTPTPAPPNHYRQARERLQKANVDMQTIEDILDILQLQYQLGMRDGVSIIKDVYKLETK